MSLQQKKNYYKITRRDFEEVRKLLREHRKPGIAFEFESAITVIEEEEEVVLKPEKKRLSKEEKLALSRRLAGSAKLFSPEGVEEVIRIANREYDQEEEA